MKALPPLLRKEGVRAREYPQLSFGIRENRRSEEASQGVATPWTPEEDVEPMNLEALANVKRELKRFQDRLSDLDKCMKPLTEEEKAQRWGHPRYRHDGRGGPETSALKRSSMDLTRALAKVRR